MMLPRPGRWALAAAEHLCKWNVVSNFFNSQSIDARWRVSNHFGIKTGGALLSSACFVIVAGLMHNPKIQERFEF